MMTPQDLQAMTVQAISAHITKRHGLELRRLAPFLAGMKEQDHAERVAAVVMFLAVSTRWTGKEAQAIRGELNRKLKAMEV